MPTMDSSLTNSLLPVSGQTLVVFLALWWAAGEKTAWLRAALLALMLAGVQLVLLLCGESSLSAQQPMEGALPVFALVILPLPMVFLLALWGTRAAPSRSHDAVGVAIFAPLLPLLMLSSAWELSPVLVLPLLLAFFLSFWLPNMVANRAGGYVSRGGELLLSLAQSADCVVILGLYLMVVAPMANMDSRLGALTALAVVALAEFVCALLVLRSSLRMALVVAVMAGLLLPLWILVLALTMPF